MNGPPPDAADPNQHSAHLDLHYPANHPIHLRKNLPLVIEDADQNLSPRMRWLLEQMWQEWKQMETDIETISNEIDRIGQQDPHCRRLRQIPGFGPLVVTATVAAIGNGASFRRGRDFAAWVGLVPRQYSTASSGNDYHHQPLQMNVA